MKKSKLNLPTVLTLVRIILVVPFMILIFNPDMVSKIFALICFIVAAVTDFIDGRLARKNNQVTDLGAFLDPLADKMLVNLAIFALCLQGMLEPWFFGIILVRDFAVDGMRMMVARTGETVAASVWGKSKTMIQMIMLTVVIFETILLSDFKIAMNLDWNIFTNLNYIMQAIVVALTVYSGADYLIKGWKKVIK